MQKRQARLPSHHSAIQRYGLALLSVSVALGGALLLGHYNFHNIADSLFLFAIAVVVWYGGPGPAVLAVVLTSLANDYFFIEPHYSFRVIHPDVPHFVIFLLFALLLTWFASVRHRVEADLRQARDELEIRPLIDVIPQQVFVFDADWIPLFANRRELEYTGFTPQESQSRDAIARIFHPEDLKKLELLRERARVDGVPFEMEARIRGKDGQYRWFLVRYNPQRDEQDRVVRWYGTRVDINERKQIEEALRRSERQLRDVVETIPTMAWTASPDGDNDFANRKWLEYTGMTVEGTSGDGWKSAIHPADLEAHWKLWSESLATGKPFENEARLRCAEQGEYRWFLLRAVPLRDESGRIVRWYGTGTDIEDRKRAEHTLLVSEVRFVEAQRLAHTGSWAWNRFTNHTYWSEETFRIYGFPLETRPSRELFLQHVHPDDLAIVEGAGDILLTKDRAVFDFRLLLPDNSLKYIHSVAQAVKDVHGQVIEFHGTAMDVTELRRAEQELQQLVDFVPQVILVLEADGTFIHANQFAQEYTGFTFEECPSEDLVTRIIHPEDELKMRSIRERALKGTEPFGVEVRLRGKDGVYRWFLFRYNPLVEGGRARRWYASATEIESRKQEEARVRKENVRLEERTRIVRELHDTLLQTFIGASLQLSAAMNSLTFDSRIKSRLDTILQFMRQGIEEGRIAIQGLRSSGSRPLDLVGALSSVHEEFLNRPGVNFRVDVAGQEQPLRSTIQDEIYRIGREALVNAFRHSGAERIQLELEYTDSSLILRIRDNGCGIDPRMLDAGRDGHWGLAGIRERATRIGGLLEISSGATGGTDVQLSVPSSVAFQGSSPDHAF